MSTTSESTLPPPSGPAVDVPVAAATVPAVIPGATDDEAVAIMAAMEALWPKPVVVADDAPPRNRPWRFSGRWWAAPLPVRRDRPWR